MAGTPKKRAKKAAGEAPTRTRARASAREERPSAEPVSPPPMPPRPPRPQVTRYSTPQPNPVDTRNVVDSRTKATGDMRGGSMLHELAGQLRPGLSVRIERLRPRWLAGWIEDTVLGSEDIGDLLEYLRDEYGGELYKLTALTPKGTPIMDMVQPIAGPPIFEGRPVTRSEYIGRVNGRPQANPVSAADYAQQPSNGNNVLDFVKLLNMMMDREDKARTNTFEAVKLMMTENAAASRELVAAVVNPKNTGPSLPEQLQQVVQSVRAVDKIKKTFSNGSDGGGYGYDDDALNGALKQSLTNLVSSAMMPPPQPQPPHVQPSNGAGRWNGPGVPTPQPRPQAPVIPFKPPGH